MSDVECHELKKFATLQIILFYGKIFKIFPTGFDLRGY